MKRQLFRITESDIRNMVMECLYTYLQEDIDSQEFGAIDDNELPDFFERKNVGDISDYPYEEDPDSYKGEEYVDLGDGDLYR